MQIRNIDSEAGPTPHPTPHMALAVRWRKVRALYRFVNRASHHLLGFTIKLVLLAYFTFGLLLLLLRYAVLPHIDRYKGDIEHIASNALGNQVSIARIYASWEGVRPNLFLGDVLLRDRAGHQLLALPSVSATLSWWSLPSLEVRFESLEIIRPDLDVRRGADGRLSVAGIALDARRGDGRGADWALNQREVVIREGRLHWTDQLRAAPELALENVNIVLRNNWNAHQFALQATPPTALGAPLDVRADFTHPRFGARASNFALWKGELFADVRATDLAAWKAYIDYPFALTAGKGAVRAWLTLDHAKLAGFTADVALSEVTARLGKGLPPLELARVSGRLSAHEDFVAGSEDATPTFGMRGHTITLSDFALETRDGLALPPTTLTETFIAARAGAPEKTTITARQLDLATLAELAAQLPLSPAQRQMLADFAPRGRLRDFSAQWSGRYPEVASYRFNGKVEALGLKAQAPRLARAKSAGVPAQAATPAIPGFENLTGSVEATEKGGSIDIGARALVLQMPTYFADPAMPFDVLNIKARWSFEGKDEFLFQIEHMDFVQGSLTGSLSGKHLMPIGGPRGKPLGTVDFSGTLSGLELGQIDRYLPLQTPPNLRLWLSSALEGGVLHDALIRLRGDLSQFPFRADSAAERARGEFRVAGRLENAKLNYVPSHLSKDGKGPLWPQAENINGSIVFDRTRLEVDGDSARTLGVGLVKVKAVVPDLLSKDMVLDIDGQASGALQDYLRYLEASPVLDWIGRVTEDTRATGNAKLALKLHIPLTHVLDTKVQGALALGANDVTLMTDLPPLQGATGKIEFSERGVNLNALGGTFLGGPMAITGGSVREGGIVIKLGGTLTAEGIRKHFGAPGMSHVTGRISGAARYSGAVVVRDHQAVVTVDSTLAGLGLELPAPLRKGASEALPLRVSVTATPGGDSGVARDDIRIALGTAMGARYQRQKNGRAPWTMLRGGIGVNVAPPEPESGLTLNVNMKTLNVDQWSSIAGAIAGARGEGRAEARLDARADGEGADLSQYVVPDVMAARAGELIIGERKLDNVVVGASHGKGAWQANIDSRQVSGHVTWNESPTGTGLGKVTARLASLIIPEANANDVKDLLEGNKSAATIPALDIVSEHFELFNKQLGRLDLQANNMPAAQGREWRINRLQLSTPDGELKGSGKWVVRDGQSSTSMNFALDIVDAGRLLDRLGFPETLRHGKGKMSGDIAWNGLPYALDIPSLSGQIAMLVEQGQFLKKDPGAAKLLGVLSLQALPHLLKLDFHDVFSEGLAFDAISANAVITRGVLKTDNLKMHGVTATVLMDGTADIANETTNLHVVVIPEFNLGTGSLMYLAVNPVIGVGSFLAQLFLRAPVMRALTYQMQIAGPWKAPLVTKLDNGKLGPVPDKSTAQP